MDPSFPPQGFVPAPSTIDGIQVFMPAPLDEGQLAAIVDFKCPQCGATTAYSAASKGLTCTHCGYYEASEEPQIGRSAPEFEFTTTTLELAAQGWGEVRSDLVCENCGAQTSIPTSKMAYTCPFCGSNKVIHRQAAQDILRPRFIIPIKTTSDQCGQIISTWMKKSWMVPAQLKDQVRASALTGLYLPFWTFDARTQADWKAEVGHTEIERYYENGEWKTRTVTNWRWESGHVELVIDDLILRGTDRISARLLDEVSNFNLAELVKYEPKYLAGLGAKSYDIPLEKAWEMARSQMRERTRQICVQGASTNQVRNFSMKLNFSDEQWRYVLLPLYLASYVYQKQSFQVVINGQNGQISGQRPADWNKIWLAIGLLLTPGLFLGLIGLLTIPLAGAGLGMSMFGFVLLIIGLVLSVVIYQKAEALDDI